MSVLASRPELTRHGREFVARMSATLAEWSADSVCPTARREADRLRLDHRTRWLVT
ncbi:hypothetical protein [Actinophytocola sp.]|uniref:hypothetical protein n=1 Tax=Actinophytocola sp. TaxID=1872138 RepID=UPI00389A0787